MRRLIFFTLTFVATLLIADSLPTKYYVWQGGKATAYDIDGSDLPLTDVDSITFGDYEVDTIYIYYNGTTATVSPSEVDDITVGISGADVTLTNTNTEREMTFVLSGSSDAGSLVYNGSYKTTILLNGLTLTGSEAEAINVKCGKRIALALADGTVNTLSDCAEDGGQKAAFYTKGHLEVSGGGTLNVTGRVKHAVRCKEYMLIKKSVGTINATVTADDGAALKSDSTVTINGGTLTFTTTGDADKGIKAEADVLIKGGTLTFTHSGSYIVEDGDASYTTSIKADGDITISGGTITINNASDAGKGISADGNVTINEDNNDLSLTINATGTGGTLDTSKTGGSSSGSYIVYVNVPSSSSNGGFGGSSSSPWSNVYLYSSDGTKVAQLTNTVSATSSSGNSWNTSSTTFYYYDFGAADSGTYYFASDNYSSSSSGGWGGSSTTYTIKSGTFTGPTNGSPYFYVVSSSYSTSGTTRTYTISDKTSTYSSYTLSSSGSDSSSSTETVKAAAIKSDGNTTITAGTITLKATGTAGKGIKCDGTFVMGDSETGTGPTLTVTTTGSAISSASSSTGNNGMGGNQDDDSIEASAKAIKVIGNAYLYGGTSEISTATDGAEGLESKANIYIEGGQHYLACYDDCINSAGCIYFNGGVTVAYSNGNDAVDSNYGAAGAITIGDGTIFAYSTIGSPEEGIDCDDNSYIRITGNGIAISAGGAQGNTSSSSTISNAAQGYYFLTSSVSYTSTRYYTLANSSGTNLVTFKFPTSVSSSLGFFTATGMVKGSTYTIKYSTTAPTDATTAFHGLYLGSSATGTTSLKSFTAQ